MDAEELRATIRDAENYAAALIALEKELQAAEKQIITTANATEKEIEMGFDYLSRKVVELFEKRKRDLVEETRKMRNESVAPLKSSQIVIASKLEETKKLINMSKSNEILNIEDFNTMASLLGSLPVVPELREVSYITFQSDLCVKEKILRLCGALGSVSRIAPVQICSIISKPGAILVEWECLDSDEPYAEVQEYHLQKALGNVVEDVAIVFQDAYKGCDLEYLAQDIKPHQTYSFKVRCKYEGRNDYSPWSITQTGQTGIKPYSWQPNALFSLSNEGKIATSNYSGTVLSEGPQFCIGSTLDFTFLEVWDVLKENFIGLVLLDDGKSSDNFNLDLSVDGTFLLEATGEVYIDGALKQTKLPSIHNGSKVSFSCSSIQDDRLRINIDVSDKRVTYDWNLDFSKRLYFVAKCASPNWKILVE